MPQASFILTLDLQLVTPDALDSTAGDVGHSLIDDGFDVVDVKPYAHPSLTGMLGAQVEAPQQFGVGLQPLGGGQ